MKCIILLLFLYASNFVKIFDVNMWFNIILLEKELS